MTVTQEQATLEAETLPPCETVEEETEPKADVVTGEIVPAEPEDTTIMAVPVDVMPKAIGALAYARDYVKLAKTIQNTDMVPKVLRNKYDAITAVFLRGFEMGIPPMQALASFDVIQGQVAMKPEAMRALIMSHGHLFILREGIVDNMRFCEVEVRRNDWPDSQDNEFYRYDMNDAKLADLHTKDNWKKNPRAMLDARATGGAARRYFADVIRGMSYTTAEVQDFD